MTKVINYCIAQSTLGVAKVHQHVGREPSGRPFNEIVLDDDNLPHNPCINSGAIMMCSLLFPEMSNGERFAEIEKVWRDLTGGSRVLYNNSMYLGERSSADRNFTLAYFLKGSGAFPEWIKTSDDLMDVLDLYLMTCSIEITSHQMAVVAATLANGGKNPLTQKQIFKPSVVRNALSIMSSAGMYDWSGEFAFKIGFPCKSGVGGGLLIVILGKMGIATFSPRLDSCGNSVRGVATCVELATRFNVHMYDTICRGRRRDPTTRESVERHRRVFELLAAAAEDNRTEIARLVQALSVDVNSADYDFRTALHIAADNDRPSSVKMLLELGADLDVEDRWGKTARDCVRDGDEHADEIRRVMDHYSSLRSGMPSRADGLRISSLEGLSSELVSFSGSNSLPESRGSVSEALASPRRNNVKAREMVLGVEPLGVQDWELMCIGAKRHKLSAGSPLARNADNHNIFFVAGGAIEITSESWTSTDSSAGARVFYLAAGSMFGEMSMLGLGAGSASGRKEPVIRSKGESALVFEIESHLS